MSRPIRVTTHHFPSHDGNPASALVRCKYIVVDANDHELLVIFPNYVTHAHLRQKYYRDQDVIAAGHITYDRDHKQPLHHVVAEGYSSSIEGHPHARPIDTETLNTWLRQAP